MVIVGKRELRDDRKGLGSVLGIEIWSKFEANFKVKFDQNLKRTLSEVWSKFEAKFGQSWKRNSIKIWSEIQSKFEAKFNQSLKQNLNEIWSEIWSKFEAKLHESKEKTLLKNWLNFERNSSLNFKSLFGLTLCKLSSKFRQ
jgi:hypothetical protein